jgi:hypothetical protein
MADLNQSQQQYNNDTQALINLINNIITSGKVTEQDKANIDTLKNNYNDSYSQVNTDIDAVKNAHNESELSSIKNELFGVKNTVEDTISDIQYTKAGINLVVKSDSGSSNLELTDQFIDVVSNNVNITADNINLQGYVTANGGFSIDQQGNMTATNGTFNGTVHSVSKTTADCYAKIEEGTILLRDGDPDIGTEITGSQVSTVTLIAGDITSGGSDLYIANGNNCEVQLRTSSGNAYFNPANEGLTRLGSATYLWNVCYAKEGVKTSSDRTLKENIEYLHYDNMNNRAKSTSNITTSDCLKFITEDYLLSTYNYIGDDKTKLSAIAQDLLYNADGSDNIIGNLIIECEEAVSEQGTLTMNQAQLINVLVGAVQELSKEVQELKKRLGEE